MFGKGGLAEIVTERHIAFIDSVDANLKAISTSQATLGAETKATHDILQTQTELLTTMHEVHTDPNSVFATQRLHRAGLHLCDLLEPICDALNVDKGPVNKIRQELGA